MRLDNVTAVEEGHFARGLGSLKSVFRGLGKHGVLRSLTLTQILYRQCSARMGSAVMCSFTLPVLVIFPRQVPTDKSLSRETEVARFAMESRT